MLKDILSALTVFAKEYGEISVIACGAITSAAFLVFFFLAVFKCGFGGRARGKFYAVCTLFAGFIGALYALNGIRGELLFSSAFLYLFYSLVLFILPVRKKKRARETTKERLELARFIDEKIRDASDFSRTFAEGGREAFRTETSRTGDREDRFRQPFTARGAVKEPTTVEPPMEYFEENVVRSGFCADDLPLAEASGVRNTERAERPPCGADGRNGGFFDEIDCSHVKNVIARLDYFGLKESDRKQIHDLEASISEAERGGGSEELKDRINDGLSSLLKIMAKYGA